MRQSQKLQKSHFTFADFISSLHLNGSHLKLCNGSPKKLSLQCSESRLKGTNSFPYFVYYLNTGVAGQRPTRMTK
jgi:hypothetical protein